MLRFTELYSKSLGSMLINNGAVPFLSEEQSTERAKNVQKLVIAWFNILLCRKNSFQLFIGDELWIGFTTGYTLGRLTIQAKDSIQHSSIVEACRSTTHPKRDSNKVCTPFWTSNDTRSLI